MEWHYSEDRKHIELEHPPKQTLKITGHRFATILGLNQYSTKFQAWTEITKLMKVPFVENKYIILGRYAEPKIIDYVRDKFPNVMSMEEYYGAAIEDYRYNNFKNDSKIFGGMFDFVCTKNDKKTIALIGEIKTTSKPQLFTNDSIPIEYQLQAALYAKLKNLDKVLFVVSFATEEDYMHPEMFEPTEDNTVLVVKKLSDMIFEIDGEYYGIDDCMKKAEDFWHNFVKTGISPEFDEVKDKEYLDIIRASQPSNDNELIDLCNEGIKLAKEIVNIKLTSGLDAKEKELKVIEKAIKCKMVYDRQDVCGRYTLKRSEKRELDEDMLKQKNPKLYEACCETTITYKLSKNLKEEGEND
jgi:predicted phage-related endonuclease